MSLPEPATGRMVRRFTPAHRWVHRGTALLMAACLLTAAALYIGPLAVLVGRRELVKTIHIYAGLALPAPLLLGLLARSVRADLSRLNRFVPSDWVWLRSRDRRTGRVPIGKFNPGQKLNAAFVAGAIVLMIATGVVLAWPDPWPLRIRQGVTFVHDWLASAVVVMTAGHLYFAYREPEARRGLRTGFVPIEWASREHPMWAAELTGRHPSSWKVLPSAGQRRVMGAVAGSKAGVDPTAGGRDAAEELGGGHLPD